MTRGLAPSAAAMLMSLLSWSSGAQPGRTLDYAELRPPQATSAPERIVVTGFFSYQCPHCAALEPELERWLNTLPDDVLYQAVPVVFGRSSWAPAARAYYTLQALGQAEALNAAIFRAIHAEGARLTDRDSVLAWVQAQGIDARGFAEVYDSFGIDAALRRAEQSANAHKLTSIPALAIDGRYLVRLRDDGSFAQQLEAVGQMIETLRQERTGLPGR